MLNAEQVQERKAMTVKVVIRSNQHQTRRVELFDRDPDGKICPALVCKCTETPRPRAGVARNWVTHGEPDCGYQWWVGV